MSTHPSLCPIALSRAIAEPLSEPSTLSVNVSGASKSASFIMAIGEQFQKSNPNPPLGALPALEIARVCSNKTLVTHKPTNLSPQLQNCDPKLLNKMTRVFNSEPAEKEALRDTEGICTQERHARERHAKEKTATQSYNSDVPPGQPLVTVVLLHYKRPENVRRVLDSIEAQSLWLQGEVDVFLFNNSGLPFADPRVTWQLDSSHNRYCWPRWLMASLARSKFVCTLDDDLCFADPFSLRDLIDSCRSLAVDQITGFAGTVLSPDPAAKPYGGGLQVSASKFPWHQARELAWQDIVVYAPCYRPTQMGVNRHDTNMYNPDEPGYLPPFSPRLGDLRKYWHYIPPWLSNSNPHRPPGGDRETGREAEGKETLLKNLVSSEAKALRDSAGESVLEPRIPRVSETNSMAAQVVAEKVQEETAVFLKVDVVKGRLMCLRTEALRALSLAFGPEDVRGDDIAVSGLLARGRHRHHRVARALAFRLRELPAPHALCRDDSHTMRREVICARFFAEQLRERNTRNH